MMKKYYFNMIEIILAIAIIAIGISSVMVLFTSGLRAGNEAVSGNNMPNVTESLIAHIRRLILSYADSTGWLPGVNDVAPTVSDANWKKNEDDTIKGKIGDIDETDGRVILSGKSGSTNYFLYRQLVATKVDSNKKPEAYATVFSAIAKVRTVSVAAPVNVSDFVDPTKKWGGTIPNDSNNKNVLSSALKVVEVVISYPADAPPESRESKIFRIEVFNDKYDRFANEYIPPSS